jgi:predicted RNase H-like HicB family nuclease
MSDEQYTVRIHDEGGQGYHLWAEVEELPGCFASGRDHDELLDALAETIGGYLSEPGHEVRVELRPEPGSVTEERVSVRVA